MKKDIELWRNKKTQLSPDSADYQFIDEFISSEERRRQGVLGLRNGVVLTRIVLATQHVAKEKQLDLVVDQSAIFVGGGQVLSSGQDITNEVLHLLRPPLK